MARFTGETPTFRRAEGPAPRVTKPQPGPGERRNKYGAACGNCGGYVEAEQGRLTNEGGKWVVSHIPPCPKDSPDYEPGTNWPTPTPDFAVPEGRYTVTFEDGSYKTFRVTQQPADSDFMPGKVLLAYLSGSDNERDYTRFAHVDETGGVRIWKKHQGNEALREGVKVLLGDPEAASKAYAQESGCCGICNRTLTTPESIARGIGPECAKKVGW